MTKGQLRPFRVVGNVAYIQLTKGYEAIIDVADLPLVAMQNWFVQIGRYADGSVRAVYAVRHYRVNGKLAVCRMHRVITGAGDGLEVDHIDGDGLNNTRANLRIATKMQNQYNARIRKDNRSGVKGVYWYPKYGKWTAKIRAGGKAKTLGYFPCKAAAAVAYARASVELHREFGRLA